MSKATNIDDFKYWDYILIHTDNMMVISHETSDIMDGVAKVYDLNKDTKDNNTYYKPTI